MQERRNLFLIHGWAHADIYAEAVALLKERDSGLADYSVPPWKALQGTSVEVERQIRTRMRLASAVIVVNDDRLHRREWSRREMAIAVELDKPIIVLQPRDNFRQSIPQVLDGSIYRVSSWRGDALGRAVRGEAPQEDRVFDIAELRDRREIVQLLAPGLACMSLMVIGWSLAAWQQLVLEASRSGIRIEWTAENTAAVRRLGVGGAVLGAAVAALATRDPYTALLGAIAVGLAGAAVGTAIVYRAALDDTSNPRVITLTCV